MSSNGVPIGHPLSDDVRYFAVAASGEVERRSIFRSRLLGRDLILWRADSGGLNAWEDRCPHRGVRLSLGANMGSELRCQYHGMRFRSGDGRCTAVPSQPAQVLPTSLRPKIFLCAEHSGFAWVSLAANSPMPPLRVKSGLTLRSVLFAAPTPDVRQAICAYRFGSESAANPERPLSVNYRLLDPYHVTVSAHTGERLTSITFLIQPVDQETTTVHGRLDEEVRQTDRAMTLRDHNDRMSIMREVVERTALRAS
jgi:phenylpropionate dioxygenase-like ring-hydroxylating dioxygenase large terminal subunit